MKSRRRSPALRTFFVSRMQLVVTVGLFSLLGLAHSLRPNEREELDPISEEFQQTRNAPDDLVVRLVEKVNDLHGRLERFDEEFDQTREHVAETSVLTTRSVETMLWDLRATKKMLSTRIAALESRVAAQEIDSKRAAAEVLKVPQGTYLSSCSNCRTKGHHLHCDCNDRKERTKATSVEIRADCTVYTNLGGLLVCKVRLLGTI